MFNPPSEQEIKTYQIIRQEIQFEYNLISNRIVWLLPTQAFLFTAYALPSKPIEFSNIMPYLGILVSLVLYLGIYGAISRIKLWQNRARELQSKLENWHGYQPPSAKAHFLGLVPPVLLPAAFLYVWLHLLNLQLIAAIIIPILISLVIFEFFTISQR